MKIICIGELLVDMIGEENKSLKDNSEFVKRPGGAPANVAVAASRMGAEVEMVATVGDDEFGEFMIEKLEKEGIDTSKVHKENSEKTTLAFASLDEEAKPHFSFYRGADEKIVSEQLKLDLGENDIVHLGSLPWTNPNSANRIIGFLDNLEATVSFDPNLRDDLSDNEYRNTLKKIVDRTDILIAAEEEVEYFGGEGELLENLEELVITRGSDGAELFEPDDGSFQVDALDTDVVDTTGAGDALTGAYLAFRNQAKRQALGKAVEAAAISITSKGAMTALPEKSDLE